MDAGRRVLAGTASGFLAMFVLSGLRESLEKPGWVHATAPSK